MNLFDLFVKIGVDDQASGAISKLTKGLGTGLATAAKVGTAAVAAAAAGITALTTASVNNYAEYEQLVGGVDTLFKDSSSQLQEYAASAYKSAGLSANDYMEQATSFAASLINSLDGDTEAAVEAANTAIIDMSDNANKMGTDIAAIQNAYQGFAKQNYTMLDNLKLGYGGTKTEMERLIEDANALKVANGEMADLSIDSYADIVDAIHLIQTEMGITGTTAAEADETITGSVGSMRAAWDNLVTGIADDNADLDTLINNFVETVTVSFENNLLPRIKSGLTGVSKLITGIAPVLISELPALINDVTPVLVDGINSIIDSTIDVLPAVISTLVEAVVPIITDAAPKLMDAAEKLLDATMGVFKDNQDSIFDAAYSVISTFVTSMLDNLPDIIALGLNLIINLAESLAENAPELIPAVITCFTEIVDTLTDPDTLTRLLDAALILIEELSLGLIDAIPELVDATIKIISSISQFLTDPDTLTKLIYAAIEIVTALGEGVIDAIPVLLSNIDTLLVDSIDRIWQTDWFGLGKDILTKVWDGLKSIGSKVGSWFSGLFGSKDTDTQIAISTATSDTTAVNGHASGLDYVPKNNYLASLHQGEAVLTAREAEIWRSGKSESKEINISINIQSGVVNDSGTARDLAQRISEELQSLTTNNTAMIGGWA